MKIKIRYERNWKMRPYPYWFNVKYRDGWRRICIPFLVIDITFITR